MRDQTYKQELRKPEPTKHPDTRMHMTIKHPDLRIPAETFLDPDNGKVAKVTPKLSKDGPG